MSSENTQRVSYIDQQMEYLENIPTRLLTIPRIVEYNELKEMNDLLTSQSDTWNSNEPIARYLFGKLFNTSSNLFYQHFNEILQSSRHPLLRGTNYKSTSFA